MLGDARAERLHWCCHCRKAAPEGVSRAEQRRARAPGGRTSLGFTALHGGRCFPRSGSGLTFPYGAHGAAPGPGPAHTWSYSCSAFPSQENGLGAFSMLSFCQLLCHPPDFPEPLWTCQSFFLMVVLSPPRSASKGRTRAGLRMEKLGCTSNPAAPNTPSHSQAALGADPK